MTCEVDRCCARVEVRLSSLFIIGDGTDTISLRNPGVGMTHLKLPGLTLAASFIVAMNMPAELAQTTSPSDRARNSINIGFVKDSHSMDGAGCSLQLPADYRKHNERYVFLSDYDNALVNIDGKDTRLKLVDYHEPEGEAKKGDRSTWNYADAEIGVRVDYIVTGVCDPGDEACEVTFYDATITVTRGARKAVVRVKGDCGS
jgi:hypothetical protein